MQVKPFIMKLVSVLRCIYGRSFYLPLGIHTATRQFQVLSLLFTYRRPRLWMGRIHSVQGVIAPIFGPTNDPATMISLATLMILVTDSNVQKSGIKNFLPLKR